MTLREVWGRLVAWTRRDELERELRAELDAHVELLARDLAHGGMSPDEALRAARVQVGNVTGLRESSRGYWGFPWVERLLQDLRYAARGLRRSPGFTLTVVLTLGLGIGANAAMFSVIDRLMIRPFPYMRDPGTVHRVYLRTTYNGRVNTNTTFPYTRYLDLKRESHVFSDIAAQSEWRLAVGRGDALRVRKVAGVSASFFGFFEAPPVRGRYFDASEDVVPAGALVAVISEEFWKTGLGSADVLGQSLKIGSLTYTIIGIAPPDFMGTVLGSVPEVYVPITTIPLNIEPSSRDDYFQVYRWDWTQVLVRRKPGVTPAVATADLTNAYIRSRAAARVLNPRVLADSIAHPMAIAGAIKQDAGPDRGAVSNVLLSVTGVAAIVLLIACASVANLMLARVIRRRREITVRLALGVSQTRLAAQFTTECLLLALLGCVAGLLFAQWSGVAIWRLVLPAGASFSLLDDWRTLGVALSCAATATLLTALGPTMIARRTDLAAMLKSGAREGSGRRSPVQSALLVFQVSLSVVLLVGAGLFVRSVQNAQEVPLGYDVKAVLEVISDFRENGLNAAAKAPTRRRLLLAAQSLPGVVAVTAVNSRLFGSNTTDLSVPGIDSVASLGRFTFQIASPEYFKVMQTKVLRGRAFTETDRIGTPLVAVVSASMAKVLWPGKEAIGQCIKVGRSANVTADAAPCTTVVGIAENAAQVNLTEDPRFMYYLPVEQAEPNLLSTMLLRMSTPIAAGDVERVQRELSRQMPGDGFVVVRRLQEVVDAQTRSWRMGATLFVALGGLAFVVAVVGLYGVLSYDVTGRMHELGVRVALGAQPSAVVRLVVGQGLRFAVIGVSVGLALALAASRWVQPLLFQLSATDPLTYGAIGLSMLLVAIAASWAPAVRASRADPNRALRAD